MNPGMGIDRRFPFSRKVLMENLKFQYVAMILSSLFLGFSVGTISLFIRPQSFDQDYHLGIFFTAGFFLGGILAPWLISILFGAVNKKVAITGYCFTAFLTVVFAVLARGAEFFVWFVFLSIVPLFVLLRIFLYLSYKK